MVLGCERPAEGHEEYALDPFAESSAPFSHKTYIALADEETACVIESFEYRVLCLDPGGATVGTFGREGEGPGEFLTPAAIFRKSRGTLAVFDSRLARLTVIGPDGVTVSEIESPAPFWVNAIQGDRVHGFVAFGPRPNQPPEVESQVLDLVSGEIVWRRSIYETARTECGSVGAVVPHPGGGHVLNACGRHVVFLEDPDADSAHVVQSPAYREEFPNQRDADAYLDDVARMGGGSALPRSALEPYAAAFLETPKSWFHGPLMFRFDGRNRLWVATTRDRDAFSWFDVWVGTDYLGSVRIRDRLMGYDILDSTLVALVEREPDRDGIAQRAIDWYDIGELELR